MEVKLLENDKDQIKLEFEAVDEAILHLFITELLKNDDVRTATYTQEHIEDDKHVLFLQVKKGRPLTAMKKAAEVLSEEFKKAKPKATRTKEAKAKAPKPKVSKTKKKAKPRTKKRKKK